MAAGATAVVMCQLKPMEIADVTPYNGILDEYLRKESERGRCGFGCRTQIRLEHLKPDGYHIKPQYDSIIDRTYAYAMKGIPVRDPTPRGEFVPQHVRHRFRQEWPRIGGGQGMNVNNGW